MDKAIPFNQGRLHLHNKHSVTLWLPNAGNFVRQTPHRYQMRLVLAVRQAILSTLNSVSFRCCPFKQTPAWSLLSAGYCQIAPRPEQLYTELPPNFPSANDARPEIISCPSGSFCPMRNRARAPCESLQPGIRQSQCSSISAWVNACLSNAHNTDNLATGTLQHLVQVLPHPNLYTLALNSRHGSSAKTTTAMVQYAMQMGSATHSSPVPPRRCRNE